MVTCRIGCLKHKSSDNGSGGKNIPTRYVWFFKKQLLTCLYKNLNLITIKVNEFEEHVVMLLVAHMLNCRYISAIIFHPICIC